MASRRSEGHVKIRYIFDDPLPDETESHIIYGLGGRDRRSIPGVDVRILSAESMTRPEALAEATTVTVFRNTTHLETVEDVGTLTVVNRLLNDLVAPERPIEAEDNSPSGMNAMRAPRALPNPS